MQNDLNHIKNWLNQNANDIYHSLKIGVNDEAFDELESLIGTALPDDFKTLYRWHDGQDDKDVIANSFSALVFLSLNKVKTLYQNNIYDDDFRADIANFLADNDELDARINPQGFANKPSWLPFMSDYGRCGLYVDLHQDKLGQFGQVIFLDLEYDMAMVVADSIGDFIAQVSQDMKDGLYHLSQEVLRNKNLQWLETDASIDLLNWQWSQRYKR